RFRSPRFQRRAASSSTATTSSSPISFDLRPRGRRQLNTRRLQQRPREPLTLLPRQAPIPLVRLIRQQRPSTPHHRQPALSFHRRQLRRLNPTVILLRRLARKHRLILIPTTPDNPLRSFRSSTP